MTWKCYEGKPIEFKGTYQWTLYHANTMLKFNWTHKPYRIPIGKGFYVEPKLVHTYTNVPPGYPVKHPSLPSDLNLIVNGPGLPKNGKEVTLQWAVSGCLSGASKTYCRQFMGIQVVKTTSGASKFTIEFISGYSEQQFIKTNGNVAFWRVCYAGPFEVVQMAPPDWRMLRAVMTFWWLRNKIEEFGDAPDCDLPVKIPTDPIDETITELAEIQVPEVLEGLRHETLERLEQIQAELREVGSLMKRSNEVASGSERLELRTVAIDHLERANDLKNKVIELLSKLEESLEKRPEFMI